MRWSLSCVTLLPLPDSMSDFVGPMRQAIALAQGVQGTTSPNPPVGCVLIDELGHVVATGATSPPGGPHAEAAALAAAGTAAAGTTAVVTLEPCNHQGRTGPCSQALIQAGVRRVVYAVSDPNPVATGGAAALENAGVEVVHHLLRDEVVAGPLSAWLFAQQYGRAKFTLKTATTVDGKVAASDGSSQWITGTAAREFVHTDRARRDAIIVGTGTVFADNPRLTARRPDGTLYDRQPARIVVGESDIPADSAVRAPGAAFHHVKSRDLHNVVKLCAEEGYVDVLVEGGPQLAGAFMAAGLVDAIAAYVAPALLGSGKSALAGGAATSMADIARFATTSVQQLGDDVLITAERRADPPGN